jgi:hypothetical protein
MGKKKAKIMNEALRKLSREVWYQVDMVNYPVFNEFDKMFWGVTHDAWEAVGKRSFKNKVVFAKSYWNDYVEKKLKKMYDS